MKTFSISEKLESLCQKMDELEAYYGFEFPTDFSSELLSISFNNTKTKADDEKVRAMMHKLFLHLLEISNFRQKPKIVSDRAFDGLPQNINSVFPFDEVYRGSPTISKQAETLFADKYQIDKSDFGNGLFTTPSKILAFSYTKQEDFSNSDARMLKLKLPSASVASDIELLNLAECFTHPDFNAGGLPNDLVEANNFICSIADQNKQSKLLCTLRSDPTMLAAVLDYDCVFNRVFPSIIVLNRAKLVVNESQANSVKEQNTGAQKE